MKNKILILSAIFFALGITIFYSCDKTSTSVDTQSAQDDAKAQNAIADAFAVANGNGGGKSACFTVTVLDPGTFTRKVKITFDAAGCDILGNGVIRTGSVIVGYSASWGAGATMQITFENYGFEGNHLTGTITATYSKILPQPEYTLTATNCVLTTADSKTISFNSTETYTMVAGATTPNDPTDNKIEINGTSSGTNSAGVQFSNTSTGVLMIYGCRYPVSGTVSFLNGAVLNFDEDGKAACNSLVKITQFGVSVIVDLGK
jgi:hypothetical protein